ncbi:Uncharacterised protein at_DN0540 [Pycnogonum litorale]
MPLKMQNWPLLTMIVILSIGLASCTTRQRMFLKQKVGSDPSTSGLIKTMSVASNISCARECTKTDNCLSISTSEDGNKEVDCKMLSSVASCDFDEEDTSYAYYQSDELSQMETISYDAEAKTEPEPAADATWISDCNRQSCNKYAVIGFEEDVAETDNLDQDIDLLHCGAYNGDLTFDLRNSVIVQIVTDDPSEAMCPSNMVVTAGWDNNIDLKSNFDSPELMKCSPVMNGWKVDRGNCTKKVTQDLGLKVLCDQDDGPSFVVGIERDTGDDDGINSLTCCKLTK